MKVIITGGEGFIGMALAAALSRRGVDVVSIDRKSGREADSIDDELSNGDVSCVYHLAAQTSVFNGDKQQIMHDNIGTFVTVCDSCRRHGTKLVYASSSTANPVNTTSMYGISKHFDEEYARCYYPRATGVRLHNVYGPRPRQGTLLWYSGKCRNRTCWFAYFPLLKPRSGPGLSCPSALPATGHRCCGLV